MRDEVQEIADITGDSLALSIEAAKTDADVIVFCGVHFMAESASILAPDKTVLLPRLDAGCPMADMVTVEGLLELKAQHPGVPVVTYVNSSAAVKAESDICCTSGMYGFCKESSATRFIIGTEAGILYRLKKENPGKEFILASPALICPNMKLTSLEDIREALTTMAPVVKVPEEIRVAAKRALDRMLAIPRD